MTERAAIETALKALGAAPDDGFDIAEAALLLAALDHPGINLAPCSQHLSDMAGALARLDAGPAVATSATAMAWVRSARCGYHDERGADSRRARQGQSSWMWRVGVT